jgi:tetratricopeptide (TPR) repeat protein
MLHQGPLSVLRSRPAPRVALLALLAWAETTLARRAFPDVILALGALRLANEFDRASELARAVQASVPAPWQTAFANEVAARLWHQGHVEEALAAWETLPAGPIASFNRGMATLFLDRPGDALPELTQAASELPEKSGWHHLAQLYLALARMRG